MFSLKIGEVLSVDILSAECEKLLVKMTDGDQAALNYSALTGPCNPGDTVVLNTTAVELDLGSGGYHFVYLNLKNIEKDLQGNGHIIKLRYTPSQLRVLALEEESSPYHEVLAKADTLNGMVVISAELHSMLAPLVLTIKEKQPQARIVYLMTDGGALPAFFSTTARLLRQKSMIEAVITCGNAFGGDLEAVNIFSGLLGAKYALNADLAIVCMGPGIAGTATPYGFSGIEMGENINRISTLNGMPVTLPRLSFNDKRSRHKGFSHHTLTALCRVALKSTDLPLPVLPDEQMKVLVQQMEEAGLDKKHRVVWYPDLTLFHLEQSDVPCSTMGRTLYEDEAFFLAAVAAASHAVHLLEGG